MRGLVFYWKLRELILMEVGGSGQICAAQALLNLSRPSLDGLMSNVHGKGN